MKIYIFAALASGACAIPGCFLWNQPVTKIESDSPLALHCSKTSWCDRRTEDCAPPSPDWPDGHCVYIGDNGRAFGMRKDGGAAGGGSP